MQFSDYFDFPDQNLAQLVRPFSIFGNNLIPYDGKIVNLELFKLALIGIPDDGANTIKGSSKAPDLIREKFYTLSKFNSRHKIIDLGNFKIGKSVNDTYFGLRDVINELLYYNVYPILLGGNSDLSFPVFMALENRQQPFNLAFIDSRIDPLRNLSDQPLGKIVNSGSSYLFNVHHFGHQTYLSDPEGIEVMNNLNHSLMRLGALRADLKEAEPELRDSDYINFSMNSIRQSDAPGSTHPSPSGLFGEEACQLAQYAGSSDRAKAFGVFDNNPLLDITGQTSHLAAQLVWYFINGYLQRRIEKPGTEIKEFRKFIVRMNAQEIDLVFYKSLITERWWMELQIQEKNDDRKLIISCSQNDYLSACNQDIPERYWRTFQKLIHK